MRDPIQDRSSSSGKHLIWDIVLRTQSHLVDRLHDGPPTRSDNWIILQHQTRGKRDLLTARRGRLILYPEVVHIVNRLKFLLIGPPLPTQDMAEKKLNKRSIDCGCLAEVE